MKIRDRWVYLICLAILPFAGIAQCTNGIESISYDTTVNGTGTRLDPPYDFSVPRFDGSLGTLMQVGITSVVTLRFNFNVENTQSFSQNYRVRINRGDDISSSALATPISVSHSSPSPNTFHGPYLLAAADGVTGSGSDFRAVAPFYILNDDTVINETVYNTADFLGTDSVLFNYSPYISSFAIPGSGIIPNFYAQDGIKFLVTYTYCSNLSLASDITSFTASKKDDATINIKWSTQNEPGGRIYELGKSMDGRTYTPVKQFASSANGNQGGSYQFNYHVQPNDKGKIIFRLKQVEHDGEMNYSQLRVVDLGRQGAGTGIRLYPNPSNGPVTLIFHNSVRSDWQVDILNLRGQVIRTSTITNALMTKINTDGRLTKGLYMIKAVNRKTQEQFMQRLVVE